MPRSKSLTRHMKQNHWDAIRLQKMLPHVSLTYIEQVLAGKQKPSAALATAIKNTVCTNPTQVDITDLFPQMKEQLPVSSIHTAALSSTHNGQSATGSTAQSIRRSGSIRARG